MKRLRQILSRLMLPLLLLSLIVFPVQAQEPTQPAESRETSPAANRGGEGLSPVLTTLSLAAELPEGPALKSDYAILIEAKSGTILYEKNAYAKAYPASTTKVLTALITAQSCNMAETVDFSYRACHELAPGSSSIARTEGEQMSVEDCLYALLVASANEVAQALAEHVSGSFEAFAAKMTLTAQRLGAVNSNFTNPHGTPDENHYTCAHDMALFMREAVKDSRLKTIMGTVSYQIAPTNKHSEITYLRMKHPLLTDNLNMKYSSAVAGKTGYTSEALNTLVTYASRDGLDLIAVVMHADGTAATGEDSIALFDYGFEHFRCYSLGALEASASAADPIFLGQDILSFSGAEEAYVTLPPGITPEALSSAVIYGSGDAGANTVAVKEYRLNGYLLSRVPLTLDPPASRLPLTPVISIAPSRNEQLRTEYFGLALIYWIIIGGCALLLLVLLLLLLLGLKLHKRNRRKREEEKKSLSRMAEREDLLL